MNAIDWCRDPALPDVTLRKRPGSVNSVRYLEIAYSESAFHALHTG